MQAKCEKCRCHIMANNFQTCDGLMCFKLYCKPCHNNEFSKCSGCNQTMLCPMCIMVWDICPKCLEKDNASLYCYEVMPVNF